MLLLNIFAGLFYGVNSGVVQHKLDIDCLFIKCVSDKEVCGIKKEGEGFKIRLFPDECALLNYRCAIKDEIAYEIINLEYCSQTFNPNSDKQPTSRNSPCDEYECRHTEEDVPVCGITQHGTGFRVRIFRNMCNFWEYNCQNHANFTITDFYICEGLELSSTTQRNNLQSNELTDENNVSEEIPNDENNQDTKPFKNDHHDEENPKKTDKALDDDFYIATDDVDTYDMRTKNDSDYATANSDYTIINSNMALNHDYTSTTDFPDEPTSQELNLTPFENSTDRNGSENMQPEINDENFNAVSENYKRNNDSFKNVIVVRGLLNDWRHVNETINRFFIATHVFDLPIKEMPTEHLNETTRRRLVKMAGPVKIYIPSFVFPKNASTDIDHRPTLHSCYHKCPKTCPKTYAPVCGLPGRIAREPSLMFLNHCFMDVAQCKQYYENKSPTSHSSAYQENSFVFCLGEAMGRMYQFLPLVKTLQHMGRLPLKGRYHYRLTNLKHFNKLLNVKNPNLMG